MLHRFSKHVLLGLFLLVGTHCFGMENFVAVQAMPCSSVLTARYATAPLIREYDVPTHDTKTVADKPLTMTASWAPATSAETVVLVPLPEINPQSEVVTVVEHSAKITGKGRNGTYEVSLRGQRKFFKPKTGEDPVIGEAYFGKDFAPGMMMDRELFATRVFEKIKWKESSRAHHALLEIDGQTQEGALIDFVPGQSLADMGFEPFKKEIMWTPAYRKSQERALVMAFAMGNQDWIFSKDKRTKINGGNLLVHRTGEQDEFYWIDNGAACPDWARIENPARLLASYEKSEQYVQRTMHQLWPMIEMLGGPNRELDMSTLWLIAKLHKMSFADFKALAGDLGTIQNSDINGVMVRVQYLYDRFVRGMPSDHENNH